jgi:hypothetical protein
MVLGDGRGSKGVANGVLLLHFELAGRGAPPRFLIALKGTTRSSTSSGAHEIEDATREATI